MFRTAARAEHVKQDHVGEMVCEERRALAGIAHFVRESRHGRRDERISDAESEA